jgi:hypothetical protein
MVESLTFKQIEKNYCERVPDIDEKEFWLMGSIPIYFLIFDGDNKGELF